jgi:hypothetical protein
MVKSGASLCRGDATKAHTTKIARHPTTKFDRIGGFRAIQVKVRLDITRKQSFYVDDWVQSAYGQGVIRKLGRRVFELPPNAFSLYLIAKLVRHIGQDFVEAYPVGFSSDIPEIPKTIVEKVFVKQTLRRWEITSLKRLSLRAY